MEIEKLSAIQVENVFLKSGFLDRNVPVDLYFPENGLESTQPSLLLINDGQDMPKMGLNTMLSRLICREKSVSPLFVVAIHCSPDRKMEYGVSGIPDYKGRGAHADRYTLFILEELIPFLEARFPFTFKEKAFAGFSLGGLMALDIVWNYPEIFNRVGVFSGSLWWRTVDQNDEEYDDDRHRIMHQRIRESSFKPGLKFFFQCGNKDEIKDRNHNGIIDSIDDTLDLITELTKKGYDPDSDIRYLELPEGRHDVFTWGKAMPEFLKWGWGVVDAGY